MIEMLNFLILADNLTSSIADDKLHFILFFLKLIVVVATNTSFIMITIDRDMVVLGSYCLIC